VLVTGVEVFLRGASFLLAAAFFLALPKSMLGPTRPARVDTLLKAAADAITSAKSRANVNILRHIDTREKRGRESLEGC